MTQQNQAKAATRRLPHARASVRASATRTGRRITLKLHYCVYPKGMAWYGRLLACLTTQWDIAARKGFLKSLRPQSLFERFVETLFFLLEGALYAGLRLCQLRVGSAHLCDQRRHQIRHYGLYGADRDPSA